MVLCACPLWAQNDCQSFLDDGHDVFTTDLKEAILYYEKAIDCQPYYPEAHYWKAMAHYKLEEYTTSKEWFTKALEQGYNRSEALLYRGYSKWMLEDVPGTIADLSLVEVIKDKNQSEALFWRGRAFYHSEKYTEATNDFNKAANLGYDMNETMLYNGYSNYMLENYQTAIDNLSIVISIKQTNVKEAFFWRGRCYYEDLKYKKSLADFNQALQLNYDWSDAMMWRGFAKYMLQDYSGAVDDLDRVAELNDNNYESAKKWADTSREKMSLWESESTIDYTKEQPKIYVVIVGVSRYNHIRSLNYTDDDAYKVAMFFKSPEGGSLPDEQLSLLIDEDATKDNIINALKNTFGKAESNDVVIFYFAGHGKDGAFLPMDYDGTNNELAHATVSDIFRSSNAKHKICIADACHSGGLDRGARDAGIANVLETYYDAWNNSSGGTALMMSSKSEETSLEFKGFRQGVFSYFLIKGLKGEADSDNNHIVTIKEIYDYVNTNVREYTGYGQNPVINGSFDKNMPVSVVRN